MISYRARNLGKFIDEVMQFFKSREPIRILHACECQLSHCTPYASYTLFPMIMGKGKKYMQGDQTLSFPIRLMC